MIPTSTLGSDAVPKRRKPTNRKSSDASSPKRIVIRYKQFEDIEKDITECKETSRDTGEPQCMALEGQTGVGKTTIVKEFSRRYPAYDVEDRTIVPVLYVETPSPATVKDMAITMLTALGDPLPGHGTTATLNYRLSHLIRECQVELVILDEFQHLIDSETNRVLNKVSDWLKSLIKTTNVPYLVVGIEGRVEPILRANAQLSRLFAVREVLRPFEWDANNPESLSEFNSFVATFTNEIGTRFDMETDRIHLLYRLHQATRGFAGNLINLLRYAENLRKAKGLSHIGLANLAIAYDKRLKKHLLIGKNPFEPPTQSGRGNKQLSA